MRALTESDSSYAVFHMARALAAVSASAFKGQDFTKSAYALEAVSKQISGSALLAEPLLVSTSALLSERLASLASPSVTASAAAASLALAEVAQMTLPATENIKRALECFSGANLQIASQLSETVGASLLKLDIGASLATTMVAQEKLSMMSGMRIGELLELSPALQRSTMAQLENVTASFTRLMETVSFPSVSGQLTSLTSYPSTDYYRHVEAIESITLSVPEFSSETVHDALDRGGRTVDDLLVQFDPALHPLLSGARAAVHSSNPDRARHAATSLRELATQAIHSLAPDQAVIAWSSDPRHLHDGRPTRRARLLYICRDIDVGEFHAFVDADVDSALALLDILQKGTHAVDAAFSPAQLQALLARFESLLMFLLQIGCTA